MDATLHSLEHRHIMLIIASPRSCCAGLRQTLLKGWQQDFPLHPSPFRQMAARSGATPRELLDVCVALQRSGALQSVRVRWGAKMRRVRWRLAFDARAAEPTLVAALAALPGCVRIERAEMAPGMQTVWTELEAVDDMALSKQLDRLPLSPAACLRLPSPDATDACLDVALAACVEEGLPLCSKPYAECGRRLGCSEQRVLASLSAWRRSGQLECLALKPPPTLVPQTAILALWQRVGTSASMLAKLNVRQGVDRVNVGPGSGEWPWQLSVVLLATPQLAAEQLRELITEVNLATAPDHCAPLRIDQPRDQAVLFNTGA